MFSIDNTKFHYFWDDILTQLMKKRSKKHNHNKVPKSVLITGKVLSWISPKLVTKFAVSIFTTPIRHKTPKREWEMESESKKSLHLIPTLGKKVMVYEYGQESKKILLVHGWSGRGTQMASLAHELKQKGYSIVSFDAPAHGKSEGKTTLMLEFIATILHLEKTFGPFEAAVGHSLGGMSLLNAVKQGLNIQKLTTIGSADVIKDIVNDFVSKLKLKPQVSHWMENHFNKKHNQKMGDYSSYLAAQALNIPVLVIHDRDDQEVPVKCASHIHQHLKNGQLLLTNDLGHRKILGDKAVIKSVIDFITS